MAKWEYKITCVDREVPQLKELRGPAYQVLETEGQEGWELVGVTSNSYATHSFGVPGGGTLPGPALAANHRELLLFFKRPVA